jgi:hypothetical protein
MSSHRPITSHPRSLRSNGRTESAEPSRPNRRTLVARNPFEAVATCRITGSCSGPRQPHPRYSRVRGSGPDFISGRGRRQCGAQAQIGQQFGPFKMHVSRPVARPLALSPPASARSAGPLRHCRRPRSGNEDEICHKSAATAAAWTCPRTIGRFRGRSSRRGS